ncbi:tetratricopeptide repeat protein [Sphingomonas cavernae]|nr:tetratricopeptide repeat protein [Sphingomonas cavernae]
MFARLFATSKYVVAPALIAAVALSSPAAANRPDAEAMAHYVRARLADNAGEPIAAASGYAALLVADPGDLTMALRTYRGALAAGDSALALDAARILDARGALPPDGRLLLFADALSAGDWTAARSAIAAMEKEEIFAFLTPMLRAWTNFAARDGATIDLLRTRTTSALTSAYKGEQEALLLLAQRKGDEGATSYKALTTIGAGATEVAVRIAVASRLSALGERRAALDLLGGNDATIEAAHALLAKRKKLPGGAATASKGVSLLFARLAEDIGRQDRPTPIALSIARIALQLDPTSDVALLLVAEMIGAKGNPDIALPLLDRINPKGPWTGAARDARVRILVDAGEPQRALETATAATLARGATIGDFTRLGERYAELKRHTEAAAAYDRALAMAEKSEDGAGWALWLLKGSAHYEAGDWPQAKAALTRAAELGPDQAVVLNYLGYAKLEYREDLEEAERLIQRASQLAPQDPAIADSLGWAYFIRGNVPKALEALERAAAAVPDEPTISEHLGDAYWTAGRRIDARYAWTAALVNADGHVAERIRAKLDIGLKPENAAP